MSCADTLKQIPVSCVNNFFNSSNCVMDPIPSVGSMTIGDGVTITDGTLDLTALVPSKNWGELKTQLTNTIKDNNLCPAGNAGNNIQTILDNIKKLQDTEQALIAQLDDYTKDRFNTSDPKIGEFITKINNVADARIAMLQVISSNANILQTGVSQSRIDLVSQLTLLQVVEDQLNDAKRKMEKLSNRNDTQMRLVEINTYYGQRYEAQSNLMKKIIMVCIPILILFILKKKSIIPETIATYVIGIVIALGAVYIMGSVWDIFTRSNMDFNTYDWNFEQPGAQSPSIWEYNKKHMFNFNDLIKNLSANLGICVGEQCCAPGLVYDKPKAICVQPPKPPSARAVRQPFTTMSNQLQGTVISSSFNDQTFGVAPFSHEMAFAAIV